MIVNVATAADSFRLVRRSTAGAAGGSLRVTRTGAGAAVTVDAVVAAGGSRRTTTRAGAFVSAAFVTATAVAGAGCWIEGDAGDTGLTEGGAEIANGRGAVSIGMIAPDESCQ